MRRIIITSLLTVVMTLSVTDIALSATSNSENISFKNILFDAPPHWTQPPGSRPHGAYSLIKQKSSEERILIHVRASALTKSPLERANEDINILKSKKLIVEGKPKSVKLGNFQWVFFEVSVPTKDVAGRSTNLYRLQYYSMKNDTMIEAHLMAVGKSFDKNDIKEFQKFLTTIRIDE